MTNPETLTLEADCPCRDCACAPCACAENGGACACAPCADGCCG